MRVLPHRVVRPAAWAAFGLLVLWDLFWLWWLVAEAVAGESGWQGHLVVPLAPAVLLTAVAWRWPRVGGSLLAAAGAVSIWFFQHPGAWLLLSGPAIILGLTIASLGRRGPGPDALHCVTPKSGPPAPTHGGSIA